MMRARWLIAGTLLFSVSVQSKAQIAEGSPQTVRARTGFIEIDKGETRNAFGFLLSYPFLHLGADGKLVIIEDRNSADDAHVVNLLHPEPTANWFVLSEPVTSSDQVHRIARLQTTESVEAHRAYFIYIRAGGQWCLKFDATFTDAKSANDSIVASKEVIENFFAAWNAADNEAIHKQVNFPHVFLVREGRASIAETPDKLITDFTRMREREGWARSEYHGFEVVHADDAKVIAKLTFTRHHVDGMVYQTVPVVWIFTNQNGHWGLQIRCILPTE